MDKIVKIMEIRDNSHGADTVNDLLGKGWTFLSACQVGTSESMDIVYVVGATKDVLEKSKNDAAARSSVLQDTLKELS